MKMSGVREQFVIPVAKVFKNMEGDLTCSICRDRKLIYNFQVQVVKRLIFLSVYHNAVTLQCRHTFCNQCANTLVRQANKARNLNEPVGTSNCCPECKASGITRRSFQENEYENDLVKLFSELTNEVDELLNVDIRNVTIVESCREAPGDTPCVKKKSLQVPSTRQRKRDSAKLSDFEPPNKLVKSTNVVDQPSEDMDEMEGLIKKRHLENPPTTSSKVRKKSSDNPGTLGRKQRKDALVELKEPEIERPEIEDRNEAQRAIVQETSVLTEIEQVRCFKGHKVKF